MRCQGREGQPQGASRWRADEHGEKLRPEGSSGQGCCLLVEDGGRYLRGWGDVRGQLRVQGLDCRGLYLPLPSINRLYPRGGARGEKGETHG